MFGIGADRSPMLSMVFAGLGNLVDGGNAFFVEKLPGDAQALTQVRGADEQHVDTVDGGNVVLKVNGLVQNEATDCAEVAGKICLQSEGAFIQFRNLLLTPLGK